MIGLRHHVPVAVRLLAKSPAFSALAALTLALGIGATTAIFGAVDAVLLSPLPFPDAERLVVPQSASRTDPDDTWSISYADHLDWSAEGFFAGAAVYAQRDIDLAGRGEPLRVAAASVSEGFFGVLGAAPALGRGFLPEEHVEGAARRLVLSHGLWQRSFGGDPGVVGTALRVNGEPAEVVGVLPPGLEHPPGTEVWMAMRVGVPDEDMLRRDNFIYQGIARLAPDASLASTRARLAALAARIEREDPQARSEVTLTAVPLAEWLVGDDLPRALWVLLAAAAFVLLIGCVNIANLLLARGAARQRELAVRAALGASRGRLAGLLLAESLVLGAAGGLCGVLLAQVLTRALVALAPPGVPRLDEVALRGDVLAVAAGVSLLAAVAFGLVPALSGAAAQPGEALAAGGRRATSGPRGRRTRSLLVVVEVGLSVVLLVGAGLTLKSFALLRGVDVGFETRRLVTMSLVLPGARYEADADVARFYDELAERVAALPGVEAASAASALPVGGGGFYLGRAFLPEGRPEPPAGTEVQGHWNVVSPGTFGTFGIPLLAGRDFTETDGPDAPPVMIVNRRFATAMFGDTNPIGRRVRSWRDENVLREIVGVVGDVRYMDTAAEPDALVYVPHGQDTWRSMTLAVRTAQEPSGIAAAVRREVAAMDADLALGEVVTMEQAHARSLAGSRFTSLLLAAFAALAVALAAIGIYGVLSYTVALRTREIGVRMALGARRWDALRLILSEAAGLLAVGLVAGLAGAFALVRLMEKLLFEVKATDPWTFAAVAALLAGIGLFASFLPARRASAVPPTTALSAD